MLVDVAPNCSSTTRSASLVSKSFGLLLLLFICWPPLLRERWTIALFVCTFMGVKCMRSGVTVWKRNTFWFLFNQTTLWECLKTSTQQPHAHFLIARTPFSLFTTRNNIQYGTHTVAIVVAKRPMAIININCFVRTEQYFALFFFPRSSSSHSVVTCAMLSSK